MKNKFYIKIIILLLFPLVLGGCTYKGEETLEQQVLDLQSKLEQLLEENEAYKSEIDILNNEIKDNNRRYKELFEAFSQKVLEQKVDENTTQELGVKIANLEIGFKNELDRKREQLWQYRTILHNNKEELKEIIKPDYILNMFDSIFIKEGDEIAGLIVVKKDVGPMDEYNRPIYEDIEFCGEFEVKGNIYYDQDSNLVKLRINRSELIKIPIPYYTFDMEALDITVLNGDKLIVSTGKRYNDNIEVTATYSGFRYYGKVEAEKMIDTTFIKLSD